MANRVAAVVDPPAPRRKVPGSPAVVASILEGRQAKKTATNGARSAAPSSRRGRPSPATPAGLSTNKEAVRARARRAAAKNAPAPLPPPPADEPKLTPAAMLEPPPSSESSPPPPRHAPDLVQQGVRHCARFIQFLGYVAAAVYKDDDMKVPEKDATETAELVIDGWPELLDEFGNVAKFTAALAVGSLVVERVGKHQRKAAAAGATPMGPTDRPPGQPVAVVPPPVS